MPGSIIAVRPRPADVTVPRCSPVVTYPNLGSRTVPPEQEGGVSHRCVVRRWDPDVTSWGNPAPNAEGRCHAVGAILDGRATADGRPARGASYNSALRYVNDAGCPIPAKARHAPPLHQPLALGQILGEWAAR
jgi:hypothetical protein